MIGERDSRLRQSIGISGGNPRPMATHDRRAPVNLRSSRQSATMAPPPAAGGTWSPLLLFVMLIGGESFIIVASSVLLALLGPNGQDSRVYAQAAIAGLGVALLFALIRPMIRFSTASPNGAAIVAMSVPGTLAALALAELAALGGYAYLAHYFGTTIPPVSFHNWLWAWAGLDGHNYASAPGGIIGNGVNFAGSFQATDNSGIAGNLNGSFFNAPKMPAAYQGGSLFATGPANYRLAGTFAAQR